MPYIGQAPTQTAFVTDSFSGTGSQTAFTMSVAPAGTTSVLVAVSGVLQDPSTYSVVGTTLTFSAAPPSGTGNISARYLGIPASGVTTTAYRTVTEFTATAGQTTFTPPSYTVGFIQVFRNGVLLGSADYTASNGTTVVLTTGATAGDLVTVIIFYVSSVLNAIPATAGSVGSTYLAGGAVLQSNLGSVYQNNGPTFYAYSSTSQTIPSGSNTRVVFDVKEWDTASCFNNTSGTVGGIPTYAFKPNIAGYYLLNVGVTGNMGASESSISIRKNGSLYRILGDTNSANFGQYNSAPIYANGTTDYFDVFFYQSTGANQGIAGGQAYYTFFSGSLIRGA